MIICSALSLPAPRQESTSLPSLYTQSQRVSAGMAGEFPQPAAMPIPGAYHVTFSGPRESADDLIAALTGADLVAEPCVPMYPEQADLGWVCVLAHEGQDAPPTQGFQESVNAKANPIAAAFGYTLRKP